MFIIIFDQNKCIKENFNLSFQYHCFSIQHQTIITKQGFHLSGNKREEYLEIKHYEIIAEISDQIIDVYLYQNDAGRNTYHFYPLQPFILSSHKDSDILNQDDYLKDKYFIFRNKAIQTNSNHVFLNHHRYLGETIQTGDKVEFHGFVFYVFDNYLYMNDFLVSNTLEILTLKEEYCDYDNKPPLLRNYYEEEIKEPSFERIKSFSFNDRNQDKKLILQLGPAMTMSIGISLLAIVNINNSLQNGSEIRNAISLLIMPCVMILSSLVWPFIINRVEKKKYKKEYENKKKEYLSYLCAYEKRLEEKRYRFHQIQKYYAFSSDNISKKWFYIHKTSKEYLKVTLGIVSTSLSIEIPYTQNKEIDEKLDEIKQKSSVVDTTLFLDLKKNLRVTLISLDNSFYFFHRILLELCNKYAYEDVLIAVYSKEPSLLKEVYHLPHLFHQGKRYTFIKERDLLDINKLETEKDIVLLMLDNSDIHFKENIHVLYFSSDPRKLLKNSNALIDLKENGLLNNQTSFQYELFPIEFTKYYDLLSRFMDSIHDLNTLTFNDVLATSSIYKNYTSPQIRLEASFATSNNELLPFDLHESKDGPHGLIGGSTGSGKTEVIVSLLLSLAIRYRSDYFNIILIDYKGGGIKESLSFHGEVLPHIIADISNLESDSFERLMESIDNECKRRLLLFQSLSKTSNASIMNLDDYLEKQEIFHFEKLAHLLIVVDEFAELKATHPDVIKKLVSFSRIGRSLGLHLILATQKPSGIIDDEIWSNSHFKIALKMHSEKDSYDVIKSSEAAYLTSPGDFILKVENNEIVSKALYSKIPIGDYQTFEVSFLDTCMNKMGTKRKHQGENISFVSRCIEQILEINKQLNIQTNRLHFDKPSKKTVKELRQLYNNTSDLILGEIDDYYNAYQNLLAISPYENLLIYTSQENGINNLLNQLNDLKIPSIVLGSSMKKGGSIKDCILYEEEEDILYLLDSLLRNKEMLIIVIEDLNVFLSYNENYLNKLYILLKRSNLLNIRFYLLSKSSNISFKILNSVKQRFIIDAYESQDIFNIFGYKSSYIGRSYFFDEKPITFVETKIEDWVVLSQKEKSYMKRIPEVIHFEEGLLGYDMKTRKKVMIKEEKLIICGLDEELLNRYKRRFCIFQNVEVLVYSSSVVHRADMNYLWVGEGVLMQRLFYLNNEDTLGSSYNYYYHDGQVHILKGAIDV